MKLPKGFGNMGAVMKQAQEAMKRAQSLEQELAMEEITVDREGVKVRYNGVGEVLSVNIDKSLINAEDTETLEDALLLALREAQVKANDVRKAKMEEITGGLQLPPGISPF